MCAKNERITKLPSFDQPPGAIAIDLDGTLLNSQTQLSERNCVAVKRCVRQSIPVIMATSRPARTVRRFLGDELVNSCSLILMNGALARAVPPLSGFVREALPSAITGDIVNLILDMDPKVRLVVELDGYEFGTNMPLDPDMLWKINAATPDMVLSLKQALARMPTKIAVDGLGHDLSAVAGKISRKFGDLVSVIPSNETKFLNIISVRASKPGALRQLLHSQEISLANVVAFGDDIPDVDMLTACGISIAVANSVSEVIAVAKYHTASNDDDGVAIVLERMLKAMEK